VETIAFAAGQDFCDRMTRYLASSGGPGRKGKI